MHWSYVQRDAGADLVEQLDGHVKTDVTLIKSILQGWGRIALVWQ